MGAETSSLKDNKSIKISNILDQLATHYILTQNFQDMKNLSNKTYCDKLIILTSDILKDFLNEREISYLSHRVEKGLPINKMNKKKLLYLDTNKDPKGSYLTKLDIKDKVNKDRMCKGIAKFYIKIAHLFSALLKAINPLYTYTDTTGNVHFLSIMNKSKIPPGANVSLVENSLCSRRAKALRFKNIDQNIKINLSKVCKMNQTQKETTFTSDPDDPVAWGEKKTSDKNLGDEIGVPELEKLYWDDYDYTNGKYVGMTIANNKLYNQHLKIFYDRFSGNDYCSNLTEFDSCKEQSNRCTWYGNACKPKSFEKWSKEIQEKEKRTPKFSDIPLTNFNNRPSCKDETSPWRQNYVGEKDKNLFKAYADNLTKMLKTAQDNQQAILGILNDIFKWSKKEGQSNEFITLNPELTEETLDKLIIKARNLILELYFTCEKDFKDGLKIFEAIIKERFLKNTMARSKDLEEKANKL